MINPLKDRFRLFLTSLLAILIFLPYGLQAQTTGPISGTILDAAGNPFPDLCVVLSPPPSCDPGFPLAQTRTDTNGNYQFQDVSLSDSYYVYVNPRCAGISLYWFWYDGSGGTAECGEAQLVSGGSANIDFIIDTGETVTGTVTDDQGNPLHGVCVKPMAPPECSDAWHSEIEDTTDENGKYTIYGLTQNQEVLILADPTCAGLTLTEEWYDGETGDWQCSGAQTVVAGYTGIDFSLSPSGTISGTVKDEQGAAVSGVCVEAYGTCPSSKYADAVTDSAGQYTITGLPVGASFHVFADPACAGKRLVEEWHDGASGTSTCESASPVPVNSTDIHFALQASVPIAGVITEADGGAGIPFIDVEVIRSDTLETIKTVRTDESGIYSSLIPADTYYFRTCASCNGHLYADRWYQDAPDVTTASTVEVLPGSSTIVVSLSLPGLMFGDIDTSGHITLEDVVLGIRVVSSVGVFDSRHGGYAQQFGPVGLDDVLYGLQSVAGLR